jgi:hypothetical protein
MWSIPHRPPCSPPEVRGQGDRPKQFLIRKLKGLPHEKLFEPAKPGLPPGPSATIHESQCTGLRARLVFAFAIALAALSRPPSPERHLSGRRLLLPAPMSGGALTGQLSRICASWPSPQPPNRIPLGLLMVARGKLTYLEVRAALEAQRRARYGKIGEWIEKLGLPPNRKSPAPSPCSGDVRSPLPSIVSTIQSPGSIPLPILEAFQMLPFNYVASTNTLHLAFGERVDHAALYASKKSSIAALSPASQDAKASPGNSKPCVSCRARATWNSGR